MGLIIDSRDQNVGELEHEGMIRVNTAEMKQVKFKEVLVMSETVDSWLP